MAQSGASLVAKMPSPLPLACEPPVRGVNKNDQLVHTAEEQRNAGNGDVKFDSTKLWRTTGDETIQEEKRKLGSGNMKIWSRKLGQHDESGHKSLLKSDALYQYILETSVYPREHEALRRLREVTAKHSWNFMATSPDEGQFLAFLVKMMNARNTLELGVYTGYSLLSTALALPTDGKIVAVDINRHYYNIGVPYIEEAGVAQKIDFREGPALDTLKTLVKEEKHHGFFDFIFVDADKDNYINYHPYLLKLVRKGGVIGYDNTLWNGAVIAGDEEPMPGYVRHYKGFVCDLNKALAKDPQIEISHIAISDGITLCRKIA